MSAIDIYGIIYKIENKINGKVYIGQTINSFNKRYPCKGVGIERMFKYHKSLIGVCDKRFNKHLYNSILKNGFDNFIVNEELAVAFDEEQLNKLETYYINKFDSCNNGYNRNFGGDNYKITNKTLKKMRKKHENKNANKQYIICTTTGKVFKNQFEASWYYKDKYNINVQPAKIIKCCEYKSKKHKHLAGKDLRWRYVWDYIVNSINNSDKKTKHTCTYSCRDNIVFMTASDCCKYYNISSIKSKLNRDKYDIVEFKIHINSLNFKSINKYIYNNYKVNCLIKKEVKKMDDETNSPKKIEEIISPTVCYKDKLEASRDRKLNFLSYNSDYILYLYKNKTRVTNIINNLKDINKEFSISHQDIKDILSKNNVEIIDYRCVDSDNKYIKVTHFDKVIKFDYQCLCIDYLISQKVYLNRYDANKYIKHYKSPINKNNHLIEVISKDEYNN